MYKRFSQLQFVIGLFFSIVAVILLGAALTSGAGTSLNLYTAAVFLIFGVAMMFIKSGKTPKP
jgi:hypothetical protein